MAEKGGGVKRCPWCESTDVEAVQRGFAGKTDGNDQYFRCRTCGKTTWEMVSKTAQEVRIGRYQIGKSFTERGDRDLIRRVLKVGFNEYLLYLRPAPLPADPRPPGSPPEQENASEAQRGSGPPDTR